MRYYEREHLEAYAKIKAQGLDQWSDLHETLSGYQDFPNRRFLDVVLPEITDGVAPRVLEYGCGTGPAACFLAARGYAVRGIDLVPDAIDIARRRADELDLDVDFAVADVCRWTGTAEQQFDVVLDSYCLQSIVLDADRAHVLQGVRRRLAPGARYVLSTALFDPARDYGSDRYDSSSGIVWTPTTGPQADASLIEGAWFLPHRRHLTSTALRAELMAADLLVTHQGAGDGDLVCCAGTEHDPTDND